jgi:hypothetical protein
MGIYISNEAVRIILKEAVDSNTKSSVGEVITVTAM